MSPKWVGWGWALIKFSAFRMGAYSRRALIRRWALIRINTVHGVQRLIRVVIYLSKFLPRLNTVCEPLRRLKDSNSVFDWLPQHEDAFVSIKELITQTPVLRYFDVSEEVTIECDSSDVGLGAVLTQDGQQVTYASRALTNSDRKKLCADRKRMFSNCLCCWTIWALHSGQRHCPSIVWSQASYENLFKTNPHKPQTPSKDETPTT